MKSILPFLLVALLFAGSCASETEEKEKKYIPPQLAANLAQLEHEDREVRIQAIVGLGARSAWSELAFDEMVKRILDEDQKMRIAVVKVLGQLSQRMDVVVPALVDRLTRDEEPEVRALAAVSLGNLGAKAQPAVPTLFKALDDPSPAVRKTVSETIFKLSPSVEYLSQVITNLKSPDPVVRKAMAMILRQMGPRAISAVGSLLPVASDPDPEVRKAVIRSLPYLARGRAKVVLNVLIDSLQDRNADVRVASIEAISRFGKNAGRAIADMIDRLGDPSPEVRRVAINALEDMNLEAEVIIPPLVELKDKTLAHLKKQSAKMVRMKKEAKEMSSPKAQREIVQKISTMKKEGGMHKNVLLELNRVLRKLLDSLGPYTANDVRSLVLVIQLKDDRLKITAMKKLSEMGREGELAVGTLFQLMSSRSNEVRYGAARALGKIGGHRALTQIQNYLWYGPVKMRVMSVVALGEGNYPHIHFQPPTPIIYFRRQSRPLPVFASNFDVYLHLLAESLRDPHPQVRREAARSLGKIGPLAGKTIPELIQTLEDPDKMVRAETAVALGKMGPEGAGAVSHLVRLMKAPGQLVLVREASLTALGKIGPLASEAIPHILAILQNSPKPMLRSQATEALGNMGKASKLAIPAITKALSDPSPWVRAGAAEALGRLVPWSLSAEENLEKALADKNDLVVSQSRQALEAIKDYRTRQALE